MTKVTDFVLTPDLMGMYLVKFFFKEGQFHLLPKGLHERCRDSVKTVDNRHAQRAIDAGLIDRAELGRHREGRIDTGDPMTLTNVRITLTDELHLIDAWKHFQAGKPARGRQKEKKSVWVVTLLYSKMPADEPADFSPATLEGIKSLQERTWSVCDVWSNPNAVGTLNFKGLADHIPDHAVTRYTLGAKRAA